MKKLAWFAAFAASASAFGQIRITEWMYSGTDLEFIEFTNVGGSAIDMSGWSYDDDSRVAFTVDLSAFGVVAAGESVILAENSAGNFRMAWGLAGTVKVIGDLATNLGRNDEINLFDAGGNMVDRLTYGDQTIAGSIRTQNASGNTTPDHYGANNVLGWALSANGDSFGSWASAGGDFGNPGQAAVVPEPATLAALSIGTIALIRRRRK